MLSRPTAGHDPRLSVSETAAYLNVNRRTVERLIDSGELRAYRLGQRTIRIRLSDIERLEREISVGAHHSAAS